MSGLSGMSELYKAIFDRPTHPFSTEAMLDPPTTPWRPLAMPEEKPKPRIFALYRVGKGWIVRAHQGDTVTTGPIQCPLEDVRAGIDLWDVLQALVEMSGETPDNYEKA